MKRDYNTGQSEDTVFFIGREVEHTPAYGMKTLFVTGVQSVDAIDSILTDQNSHINTQEHIRHIFFGANHSFNPQGNHEHEQWETMITYFLEQGYWCSLDIPMNQVVEFNDGGLSDYVYFIAQIRVPIPYIKLWNYNTMIKIDDRDFKATNPGVWSHSLHALMDRSKFTDWSQYKNDIIIK